MLIARRLVALLQSVEGLHVFGQLVLGLAKLFASFTLGGFRHLRASFFARQGILEAVTLLLQRSICGCRCIEAPAQFGHLLLQPSGTSLHSLQTPG
ncbi:hypothetical protein D9M71_530210 [compost metagenome]